VSERKIRVLISVIGLDQHEAGALAISRMLRDNGVEVIYTGRFSLPATILEVATQEDVDVVGISAHSWEFLYYADELVEIMSSLNPPVPVVVGGSVITDNDRQQVLEAGLHVMQRGATQEEIVAEFRRLADPEVRAGLGTRSRRRSSDPPPNGLKCTTQAAVPDSAAD
jgi:methylmalonyl-CoA mutase C-terminal domain/subunit